MKIRLFSLIKTAYKQSSIKNMSEEKNKSDRHVKIAACSLLGLASLVLTILNIVNEYWFMMFTTLGLTVGFVVALILYFLKFRVIPSAILFVLIAILFSIYAIKGENEGFAILWILIVPPIAMSLIGLRFGTLISGFFQLFLIVLFYTPLRDFVADYYTETFLIRFPLLYLTSFAISVLISSQKEFYYFKTENMAFLDPLTELNNRRYYESVKNKIVESQRYKELTIISVDINRLKFTNDNLGHEAGDQLIEGAAKCMFESFPDAEAICRTGGDEFIILTFANPGKVATEITSLVNLASAYRSELIKEGVSLSVGVASGCEYPDGDIHTLEVAADKAMYTNKSEFYVKSGIDRRIN